MSTNPKCVTIDWERGRNYLTVFDEEGRHLDQISHGNRITNAYCSGLQVIVEDEGNMVTTYDMSSGNVKRMNSRAKTRF